MTLAIMKPDIVERSFIGKIATCYEENRLRVVAMKMKHLSRTEAEGFYAEHRARPFFGELVEYIASKPVVLLVLKGENAIARNRDIMGATDPAKAAAGTIRKLYARSIGENSVHGSDSPQSAAREIHYFFSDIEIYS